MSKLTYASLAGTGALGASGFGIYHLYSGEPVPEVQTKTEVTVEVRNLRSKLTSQGFTILTSAPENQKHWEEIKTEYDKVKAIPSKSFHPTSQEVTIPYLQDLCKTQLEQDRDDLFENVKRWCVVPTTISNHLVNLKLTPLSISDSDEPDKSNWEALAKEYGTSGEQVSDWTIPPSEWKKLKEKCKEVSGKKNYDDDFNFGLHTSMRWCVKK
ncbi:hypothetical protein HF1_09140 [Mycoplasma haemofelis str. Langford 1]|uniref:Uncharacterized protein n=2 Tax=Mycoplasma haemofelis TaxID=29501 RepID=F6FJ53_MYCHI|nr:hypothetical protein [Mycoplasma haemofelis]AEG73251.1 hypothetical protein MHF_0996 [Mycoplasma haemofelis Ohio2]CBY92922.1 hypothetical protein HF1_09140 [Mycoplasma haemofelis str. Langford 1]